jgi:F-type H+-transporting ATPase subunit epsilon
MRVAVVSPEEVLFEGDATQVITRTTEGDVAFLSGHAPFVGVLAAGSTRVFLAGGEVKSFDIDSGFVEVSNDTVSILAG